MALGTLYGHAIPIVLAPWWDHTYVTSSGGHIWGCFGRLKGGRVICSGSGNMDMADCLSQVNSSAALIEGRTGRCHQAANRILFPSGQFVSRANGYRLSTFQFGTYGRDPVTNQFYSPTSFPWPELRVCRTTHTH